jgi:hypothetical protein
MSVIRSFTYVDSAVRQTNINIIWRMVDLDTETGGDAVGRNIGTFTTEHRTYDAKSAEGVYWLRALIIRYKLDKGMTGPAMDEERRVNRARWDAICEQEDAPAEKESFVDVGMSYSTRAMKKRLNEIIH